MKPVNIRVLTASGAYLRRHLQRLCNQVGRASARSGSAHRLFDGYLLRANKSGGRVTGTLVDLPAFLWFAGSVRYVGATDTTGLLAPIGTGRDAIAPGVRALPPAGAVTIIARPTTQVMLNQLAGDTTGAFHFPLYARLFEQRYALETFVVHAPADTLWETSMNRDAVALVTDCYLPPAVAQRVVFLEEDAYWEDTDDRWGEAIREDRAFTAVRFFFEEDLIHTDLAHRIYPKADGATDTFGQNASSDLRPWSTQLPWLLEDDGSRLQYMTALSTVVQASGQDSRGRACQLISRLQIDFSADDIVPAYAYRYLVDPLNFANTAEHPLVLTRNHTGTGVPYDYHQLNYQAPTYMAKTGDTVACMVRWAALTAPDSESAQHWQYTAKVIRIDPSTGGTTTEPLLVPSFTDTSDGADTDWWYWAAIGMDSDGSTAVYVAMFNWLVSEDPLEWDVGLGIVTVDEAGAVTAFRVTDPGCYAFPGRLNSSVHLNNPESGNMGGGFGLLTMVSDGVTYIGNGKFIFPVSLTAPVEPISSSRWSTESILPSPLEFPDDMPMDFTLAQYQLGGGVSILSTVKGGLTFGDPYSLPGRVTVVQQELADPETDEVVQQAVLIASLGNGTAKTYGILQDRGETYISYDSGASWELLADTGSGKGVYYTGSTLVGFRDKNNLV